MMVSVRIFMGCREWIFVLIPERAYYASICRRPGEYSDATWLPPSRWDDGIPGLMLDYNLNGTVSRNYQGGDSHQFSYNGTVGGIWGPGACGLTIREARSRAATTGKNDKQKFHMESLLSVPCHSTMAGKPDAGRE